MERRGGDSEFAGSIPEIYDTYLVPMIFETYAADLSRRVAARSPKRVLEIAAGTGVVTRAMATALPASTHLVASDLNPAMLERAAAAAISRPVEWRRADALKLPFGEATFDAVVCQFGVMFFADKAKAFAQMRRVLAPGGVLIFSVWDRIEDNEFAECVTATLAAVFADDPPRFLARTPHGYYDRAVIEHDLASAGFEKKPSFETLPALSRAASAHSAAIAYCQGTPLRNEIDGRGAGAQAMALKACTDAIAARFGTAAVDGRIQAHVISVDR